MFNNTYIAKMSKPGLGCAAMLLLVLGATGCSNNINNGVKKASVSKAGVVNSQQRKPRQVVAANQPRKANNAVVRRTGKDKHHLEFERKRMIYNQQWLAKQKVEASQRSQRLKYQQEYERNQRLQEQEQGRSQQQRQQQLAMVQQQRSAQQQAQVVARQRSSQNLYLRKQAQIEAQQQQHNWKKDGGWRYANRSKAGVRQAQPQPRPRAQPRPRYVSRARTARQVRPINLGEQLSNAAIARTYQKVRYDGRYIPISYPMGDVPANMGVCTDTLIRSYRRLGIDLQQLVHEDISRAFHLYPNLPKWGLSSPDPNIDHRRVHNLKVFFARHGRRLPVTNNPADYRPGDIVTWHLGGDQEHIGLVVNRRSPEDPRRYMIVHNIAKGDRMEDMLFRLPITGHYRYLPHRSSRWLASR